MQDVCVDFPHAVSPFAVLTPSLRRVALCDGLRASEPPLLLLLRPHSLARPLTRSLSCDGSQVINGINPVVYYCWLACYYR